jgi:Uma2 family endonuclease
MMNDSTFANGRSMNLVLADTIRMPYGFASLKAFRRWTKSADYPQRGEFSYLAGDLWVDLTMETLLHNLLKSQFVAVLTLSVVEPRGLGRWLSDRMRLVNTSVNLSTEPDGMFVSNDALRSGQVRLIDGEQSLEVIGAPEVVLEIVSKTSIQKDTVALRELYAAAGIAEYWLVDPLGDNHSFDILRLTARGYSAARKSDGWVKSGVFGKSFKLVQEEGSGELPAYRLLVR